MEEQFIIPRHNAEGEELIVLVFTRRQYDVLKMALNFIRGYLYGASIVHAQEVFKSATDVKVSIESARLKPAKE